MALKDKLDILFTGYRDFNEEQASVIISQGVHGVTNAVMVNDGDCEDAKETEYKIKVALTNSKGETIKYGTPITAGEEVTYIAKIISETLTAEELKCLKGRLNWMFWVGEEKMPGGSKYHSLSVKTQEQEFTTNYLEDHLVSDTDYDKCYTFSKFESSDEAIPKFKEKLTIKWSKWLEYAQDKDKKIRIRVEAYIGKAKRTSKANDAACSRIVKATPEILDTYWMNAEGQKVNYAGYDQDLYLYLKTLGLKNKEIEVQVHEQDYYNTPAVPKTFELSNNKSGDELIEWKNNQIKIDNNGEALKQFKVGDKKRYEEAQKDEDQDEYRKWWDDQVDKGYYFVGFDPTEKYGADLELYIHFPEKGDFKPDKDNKFAKLTLTEKTMILDAYFADEKKEKVQADAPATKKNANPTTKATHYQKLDKGVLGQTVQLVAECPNLEGKTVAFHVFEKTPLLGEKNKALTFIYKDQEKTRIEAKVKEGFAVAEVKLQHRKDDADNKDLLDKLKNGFNDDDKRTAQLYLNVEATQNVFTVVNDGEFLKDAPFKMIGNNWHEPVDDPQIAIYTQYGAENTHKNTYGTARGYTHAGLDIFALEGSNVYSCLDGEVYEVQKWTRKTGKSGYGHNVTIEVKIPQEVINRRREYTLAYKTDKKQGSNFNPNSSIFYLRYAHLEDILVKQGDKVKAGQIIAKSGISGVIDGTKDPHLHFNIYSDVKSNAYLVNPAFYVYWKEIDDLTETDKKVQKDRMEEGLKVNPAPKLSKIK